MKKKKITQVFERAVKIRMFHKITFDLTYLLVGD